MNTPSRPEQPRTRTVTQSVPDHEVLLVFNGDDEAVRFSDWLDEAGWPAFERWCAETENREEPR